MENIQSIPSQPFFELSEELIAFNQQLDDFFTALKTASHETLLQWEKQWDQKVIVWQNTIIKTRTIFEKIPCELAKRDIGKNMRNALDQCESTLNSCREQINKMAPYVNSGLQNASETWGDYLNRFKLASQILTHSLGQLMHHPLFKKIQNGELVLASRQQLQWSRKFFHTFSGLAGLWFWAYSGLSDWIVLGVLGAYFTYAVLTEIFRKKYPAYNRWMIKIIGGMMREREKTNISSATYYIGSMFLVMLVFPKEVSILTLFFIAVGDTIAGIVGVLWGRHKITRHASLEGTLACFTVCFLATCFFVSGHMQGFALQGFNVILFSLLAGVIACIAESSFKKLDDNLVMPLLSAPALTILMYFFR